MACPDTQIFLGFFSTASPEWLRTCPEGMSGDSGHLADPPELPCLKRKLEHLVRPTVTASFQEKCDVFFPDRVSHNAMVSLVVI